MSVSSTLRDCKTLTLPAFYRQYTNHPYDESTKSRADMESTPTFLCLTFLPHHPHMQKEPSINDGSFNVICNNLSRSYSCFWALILMPGPMVLAVVQERMY